MLTEADTCRKFVVPKLQEAGWDTRPNAINEQRTFTDGRIVFVGGKARRGKQKRADYLLRYRPDFPIAIVEAKSRYRHAAEGLQQAKEYAEILGVKFAYSTNGAEIIEFDYTTGVERLVTNYPSPSELWQRLRAAEGISNDGAADKLLTPTYPDRAKPLRYYQEIAVNRAVQAVLQGRKRTLLTLCTGAGKTAVAFQISWKLANVAAFVVFFVCLFAFAGSAEGSAPLVLAVCGSFLAVAGAVLILKAHHGDSRCSLTLHRPRKRPRNLVISDSGVLLRSLCDRTGASSALFSAAYDRETAGPRPHAPAKRQGNIAMSTTILLLLVEDEALIQELLEVALTEAGFELSVVQNGTSAMAELEADATRFRAVITDIRLGAGPDGWEIGRRARELMPDVPVVYMSGDSGQEWSAKGVPNSIMVAKPFAPAQIITAVSGLLNDADSR